MFQDVQIQPPIAKQYRSVEVQTRETMLKVHIHQLPNECLSMIFKDMTLQQRIPLIAVCSRWHGVIGAICAGKQSLKLISNRTYNEYRYPAAFYCSAKFNLEHDRFVKPSLQNADDILEPKGYLNRPLCDSLARLFPNVQQLHFSRDLIDDESSHHLVHLLQQWPALTGLILEGGCEWHRNKKAAFMHRNVVQAIRQLDSLQHLYLFAPKVEASLPVKTISQLNDLYIGISCSWYAGFLPSLAKLKPDCRVRLSIWEDQNHYNQAIFPKLTKFITDFKPKLARQVTHFTFEQARDYYTPKPEYLNFVLEHFVNLQYLELRSVSASFVLNIIYYIAYNIC